MSLRLGARQREVGVLAFGVAFVLALLIYRFWGRAGPEPALWGPCQGEVEQRCAEAAAGQRSSPVAECLVGHVADLSPACGTYVKDHYRSVVANRNGVKGRAARQADQFNVKEFLAPCRGYWDKQCTVKDDRSGANVLCYANQPNLSRFPERCLRVMVEVLQWSPQACTGAPLVDTCGALVGLPRLMCAHERSEAFPEECGPWLKAVRLVLGALQAS